VLITFKMVILIIGKLSHIKLSGVVKLVLILRIKIRKRLINCMVNVNKMCRKIFYGMVTLLYSLARLLKKLISSKISTWQVGKSLFPQKKNLLK
jgi:hypothetical protein